MPKHWRHLFQSAARGSDFHIWWSIIKHDSYVVVTAAEAQLTENPPGRFKGDAWPVIAGCIAPQDGNVLFTLWWYGDYPYLNVWTDITVFDPGDFSGTG
jgi:hypothetical protein